MTAAGTFKGRTLLVVVALATSLAPGAAQGASDDLEAIGFRRLEAASGPSHNSIFALLQDHRGFLWVGTQDGLDRWDGVRFESFRHDPDDPDSISADQVRALLEDSARRLWVVTAAGIDLVDRDRGRFQRTGPAEPVDARPWSVSGLVELDSGALVAGGASGLYRWSEDSGAWKHVLPEIGSASSLHAGPGDTVWVLEAFAPGRPQRLWRVGSAGEARAWTLRGRAPDGVYDFAVDPRGRVWLDAGGPVAIADDSEEVSLPWGDATPPGWPLSFLLTDDGTLWMGTTYAGVVRRRLDLSTWDPVGAPRRVRVAERRLGNWAGTLLVDATGIVWIGTEDGLYRHDPNLKPFRHWGRERVGRLPPVSVSAIGAVPDGGWWLGTFGDGLYRLSADGDVVEHVGGTTGTPGALPGSMIWSLAVHDGTLVVGLDDGGLCLRRLGSPRFRCRQLPVDRIGHIVPAHGRLWLAALDGLVILDPESGATDTFPRESPRLAQRDLTVVLPTSEHEALVGTWAGELLRLDRRRGGFRVIGREPELTGPVLDLHRGSDGSLWIAHGEGLSRQDPATGAIERVPFESPVPGSNGFSILEDGTGRLWLGTNRGLVRYDPRAEPAERLRPYGPADGLENREFNRHARFRSRDGRLFLFGGERGVTLFAPDAVHDNPHPPPVRVVAAEVAGSDGTRRVNPWSIERLRLSPREDAFQLEVAALSFTAPEQNRYRHRLEGYDERWIESGTVREIRYSHLPPDRYLLRVQAANNDGVWNREGLSLPVLVAPPFWQTWWFRLALGLLAVLALYGAHHVRVRRLVEIERLRLRIAADLHDQLSSDLSGIALTTDLVRRHADLPEGDRSRLERVRDQALQSVRALRDIVWYVDPERDALASLGDRMRQAADDLLPEQDVHCEVRLPEGLEAPMLWRRDLFLAYKEMLHNVARHAGAARVEVELVTEDGGLRLRVVDDGGGFDPESVDSGAGLPSLRRRAEALGGDVEVRSLPGEGTTITLEAPLPGRAS